MEKIGNGNMTTNVIGEIMKIKEKLNYCIGRYWDKTHCSICTYEYFGTIHYETFKEAEDFLTYVLSMSEHKDWKIFKVVEL